MKTQNAVLSFICGALLGVLLALNFRAGAQTAAPAAKRDLARLVVVTYPTGATAFFDPDTGRIYMYDVNLEYCYAVREITTLGATMNRLRN